MKEKSNIQKSEKKPKPLSKEQQQCIASVQKRNKVELQAAQEILKRPSVDNHLDKIFQSRELESPNIKNNEIQLGDLYKAAMSEDKANELIKKMNDNLKYLENELLEIKRQIAEDMASRKKSKPKP